MHTSNPQSLQRNPHPEAKVGEKSWQSLPHHGNHGSKYNPSAFTTVHPLQDETVALHRVADRLLERLYNLSHRGIRGFA